MKIGFNKNDGFHYLHQDTITAIENNGPLMSQTKWPRIGRHIGTTGWVGAGRIEDLFMAAYQNLIVHGDEIPLATNRISLVNNLKYAHDQGYSKDIAWK